VSIDALVDDPRKLDELIARSPLLPEATLRQHWQSLVAHLPLAARHELAEILLDVEQACQT